MQAVEIIMLVLGLVVGATAGAVIAWLIKSLKTKAEIATLQKDLVLSQEKVVGLTKQNAELQQKYLDSQSLLANTLSALELLKAYQMIDAETKKKVEELKDSFVDGKASPDTMDKYKEMIKKMNEQFSNYNKGQKTTTTKTGAKRKKQ